MTIKEEMSVLEATVNELEAEMESGEISVDTLVNLTESHINSTPDLAAQVAKCQESMKILTSRISKIDVARLTTLKHYHSHEPHVCKVISRAANCHIKLMGILASVSESFGDPDVRMQIKAKNQEMMKNLKDMLASIL